MKRKTLPKLIIIVSLVAVLAIVVPVLSGCFGKPAAEPAPAEPAPAEPAAPAPAAEPEVITAKVGFLGPLTGEVAGWGLPGFNGCEIYVERLNEEGGIVLPDGTRVMLELIGYDDEYIPDKTLAGARKLVLEDGVSMVMTLGGSTAPAVVPFLTQQKMYTSTLTSTDLSPESTYLFATTEVAPMYDIASLQWVGENCPELKTIALCSQDDEFGRMHMAATCAAAEAAGIDIVYNKLFSGETTDFAPIVSAMMATDPDFMHWTASWPPFVVLLTEQAYLQGYEGETHSGTFDLLDETIEKTSVEFMENASTYFPILDDPMLSEEHHQFYEEYNERYPGQWAQVAYEYPWDIKVWQAGVERAGSLDADEVVKALKAYPPDHCFGPGMWWGRSVFGIDNSLITDWPVVVIKNGTPRIQEFKSMTDWWGKNKMLLIKWLEEYEVMWYQRLGVPKEVAVEEYGLYD